MPTTETNAARLASESIDFYYTGADGGYSDLKPWHEIMGEQWATRETLRREVDA